jgi:hypothetical protein
MLAYTVPAAGGDFTPIAFKNFSQLNRVPSQLCNREITVLLGLRILDSDIACFVWNLPTE